MFGAFHIEIVMLTCIVNWLQNSGWEIALSNREVTSSGNYSLLTGHDVAERKYIHQVTALALHHHMNASFEKAS